MGLLDFDANKLVSNPLLQMGMGILGSNRGHYGAFAPAFGQGVQQGMANLQAMQQQQMLNDIRKQQMEAQKAHYDQQAALLKQKQAESEATQSAYSDLASTHPEIPAALWKLDPKRAAAMAFPQLNDAKYGMAPRIGLNPATNKPEYVQFSDSGKTQFTGILPTLDEIKMQELIDKGAVTPDSPLFSRYQGQLGTTQQTTQNNAPNSVPVPSSMGYTWSGPTPTDIKEGTSPDMVLRDPAKPNPLPPASQRKLAEKQAEIPIDAASEAAKAKAKIIADAEAKSQTELPQAKLSAQSTIDLVDQMLAHPGFKTAIGLSSKLDPRNYLAGTDAKDFNIMLDQLKGRQFMEAYQNLKGGGQITEVEGKKATDAMSRMNTASSEDAFRQAAQDFKSAVSAGYEKLQKQAGVQGEPLSSNPTQQPSTQFSQLPKASQYKGKIVRDTTTGKRLRSNGMSWEEVK